MQALLAPAMKEMFFLALLALLSCVPSSGSSDYEYVYATQASGQNLCTEIPRDLRLCYGIGYTKMLLPNLLEHETMAEVKQQTGIWVPLVQRKCHADTQVFLCSLFAPVCLDKMVLPCQQLCESVRNACSPIMEVFGFDWPDMFNCSKFPHAEHNICINNRQTRNPEVSEWMSCPQCEIGPDFILQNICASELAIKAKIKRTKTENGDKKVILQKRKKAVWNKNLGNQELKKLELYLKNGAYCPCPQLNDTRNNYLITVRKVNKHYLLAGIHKWEDKTSEFQKLLDQLKTNKCSEPIFK